jgi:hypothetical protein
MIDAWPRRSFTRVAYPPGTVAEEQVGDLGHAGAADRDGPGLGGVGVAMACIWFQARWQRVGVMAMASGPSPTGIGLPAVLLAVATGVTLSEPELTT